MYKRQPAVIGTRINQDFEQLRYGNGIDHNWVLNTKGDIHQVCATLESPVTGLSLIHIFHGLLDLVLLHMLLKNWRPCMIRKGISVICCILRNI